MGDWLAWWLAVEVMALAALPLTFRFFSRLPDRGFSLAKPFALLLTGYALWTLNMARLVPNTPRGIAAVVVLLALVSAAVAWPRRGELRALARQRWAYIVGVEALFFASFAVGAWLRSYVPDIGGTEKPMDFMFLNAASRADRFPPPDPWLSGFDVAYYYFGYLVVAMVGELAGVATNVGYNLGLAMIAGLTFVGAFGVTYNAVALARGEERVGALPTATGTAAALRRAGLWPLPAVFGTLAAVTVAILGNLEGVFEFTAAHGLFGDRFYRWLEIKDLALKAVNTDRWYPTETWSFWWWFRASRVLSRPFGGGELEIITEFPVFSFVLGDLHPHVMALPFMLLASGTALQLLASPEPLDLVYWFRRPGSLAGCALIVGGLGFINTWDAPTFGVLLASAALVRNLQLARVDGRRRIAARALDLASFAAPLIALALAAYAPFFFGSLDSQADGVAATSDPGTRPIDLVIFWGPMAVVLVPLVGYRLWEAHRDRPLSAREASVATTVPALLLLVWLLWDPVSAVAEGAGVPLREAGAGLGGRLDARGSEFLTLAVLGALFGAALLALWREIERPSPRTASVVALMSGALGLFLVYAPELFYLVDSFGTRMNTVFKLWYQAWALLGVASACAAYELWEAWLRGGRRAAGLAWAGATAIVLLGGLLYPVGATLARTDGLGGPRTLDGLAFVRNLDAGEYEAIRWLYARRRDDIAIAEAVGNDYTYGGRMSAATGIPAPLQWPGHELQWRGETQSQGSRQADIERLYRSTNPDDVADVVNRYGITFVIVGRTEREQFPGEGLAKFDDLLGPPVFQSGETKIYNTVTVRERGR
jgi:YYY domain-containing protein